MLSFARQHFLDFPHKCKINKSSIKTLLILLFQRNIKLSEAPSFGKTIFHYEPSGKGAKAYERLAREIIEKHQTNYF